MASNRKKVMLPHTMGKQGSTWSGAATTSRR